MNKPELESLLKKARLPEIAEESLEMFPREVIARLKRNEPPVRARREFSPPVAWALGLAACLVVALAAGRWSGPAETRNIPPPDQMASAKLIHELMAMFPNRLRAIVQDERGLNLVLAESADVAVSPPLYIRIWDRDHYSSFVTFSGQEIQVDGQTITTLADPRGGILVSGNQFVWSNTGRANGASHLRIEARILSPASM